MREFNLLEEYPKLDNPRIVNKNLRTIDHRIISTKRDIDFFDGDRNYGYGGFKYDGRWKKIADKIIKEYELSPSAKILHLSCEKGFLLHDFLEIYPELEVKGLETSNYAIENSMEKSIDHK